MNPPRILIVDDEANIRFVLENILQQENYIIETACSGAEALQKLNQANYDLLLLDLHMEPVDGLEVLNQVRAQDTEIEVIILTAYSSVESAVEALRLGAFDYLFKPATSETIRRRVREGLLHRQKVLRRRTLINQIEELHQALNSLESEENNLAPPPTESDRFVRCGQLIIDRHHRSATLGDTLLDLTTTEFDLLLCLVTASPSPVSAPALVTCALGYQSEAMEARDIIKWHIHQLRRKIEPDPANPHYIKTIRHKGYLWSGQ